MQMTLALVALCGMLIVLADVLFGVFPDRAQEQLRLRKQVGEAVAVQVAALLRQGDKRALQETMDEVALRTPSVRSLGLRRADGVLVIQAGDHAAAWGATSSGGASTAERIDVPMNAQGRRWGSFELAFKPEATGLQAWTRDPMLRTMAFVTVCGMLAFGLYMRRALQHLDPSSVIPERVQGAFDAMAEGVAVLDARGRLLLANRAFRALNPQAAACQTGQPLSSQPWLSRGLGPQLAAHPWMRAMGERAALSGQTVDIHFDSGGQELHQQLVINAAPIMDSNGRVRGCLTTFSDVSELYRKNVELRRMMVELEDSKTQVQKQNDELKRLATRDPMTGCLNRRAFSESYETMFQGARQTDMALSCMVLDIDFFKKVNDTYGHSIGDRVIQEVAKQMQALARASDLVCRYGGEEFCLVLPGQNIEAARQFAERVRKAIERDCGAAVQEVPGMKVTVSIGVAEISDAVATPLELIDRADHALYEAKKSGRNRVCADDGRVVETA